MANILTLDEALVALKRDSDLDGEVQLLLDEVDAILEQETGIKWQDINPIPVLAKSVARLWLQIETGILQQQLHRESLATRKFALQMLALQINNKETS